MWNDSEGLYHRRTWLHWNVTGLATIAACELLQRDGWLRAAQPDSLPLPHTPPRCRRVLQVFLCGGLSQIDTFDYKPTLARHHGQSLPASEKPETFFGKIGLLRQADFPFAQHGESGLWISELFPHLSRCVDDLTIIRSMRADSANHTPATFQANTGFRLNGFPVLGAWLSYGLGSEADNLPAYVVLPDPRGYPAGGTINWTNGFLPAQHQGVALRTRGDVLPDLFPSTFSYQPEREQATRAYLEQLEARYRQRHPEGELQARLQSYALAARMQLSIPQVTDLAQETQATQEMYGLHQEATADCARQCLLARRLLEHGVRIVQIFSGGSFGSPRINWDAHENTRENHLQEARRLDQPLAALLLDLKQRGLLDDTLVLITTEFGRTPFTQAEQGMLGAGRDHNMYGFSIVLAGGGLKPGYAYGHTDDLGWKAVDHVVTWPDLHATILHLLGLDHTRLTYYHNGIQRRLTNVHGEVLHSLLA